MLLLEEVKQAKSGNGKSMMNLISCFLPLIKKYGRKLGYEDATEDIIVDFVEFISKWNLNAFCQSSDGAVVKYIVQSLYHIYLARLKDHIERRYTSVSLEDISPSQMNSLALKTATWDEQSLSTIIPDGVLTSREFFILTEIYERGTSVTALAQTLHVSRQNINQIKKKAERKLKQNFGEKS